MRSILVTVRGRAALLFLILSALLAGCRPPAQPADPDRARTVLREALDAWRNGDTPESLRGRSPSLTVVEPRWKAGFRLLDYELVGDGGPAGFDWQGTVKLSLQDPAGKKQQEKAVFNVSTAPALVVVRSDDS
jgi:hypothetical protein